MSTELEWHSRNGPVGVTLPAAKLHVLRLGPIKDKIGERWPRLSLLVHALFERALNRAQGPLDRFIRVGELCYVVTFHGRSPQEADIVCVAIAREVCERLFGEGIDIVSVRSVVGEVAEEQIALKCTPEAVARFLEQVGKASVVTKSCAGIVTEQAGRTFEASIPGNAVIEAHRFMLSRGRTARFFPLWDLKKRASSALILRPVGLIRKGNEAQRSISGRALMAGPADNSLHDLEISLLKAAAEFAQRVQAARKVCAVGTGVSYDTLSSFAGRVRYITNLRALRTSPVCPLLLKIEDIPQGVPLGRLAEIMNMVAMPNVRFMLEFSNKIPELDFKLGAAGIGIALSAGCSASKAEPILNTIPNRLLRQQAFGFVSGLNSSSLVQMAGSHNLHFGMGAALDGEHQYTGLERVPDFPLVHNVAGDPQTRSNDPKVGELLS